MAGSIHPLIFFVHNPKSGGSSVNAVLRQYLPAGHDHCETFWDNETALAHHLDTAAWLSGHIPFDVVLDRVSRLTRRPVRYFTCLRTPVDHLRSTINWCIEMYHKGSAFYDLVNADFKAISEEARSGDGSAGAIAGLLYRHREIFSNVQTSIVLGTDVGWNPLLMRRRAMRFEMIGDTNDLPALARRILGRDVTVSRENASPYHFDPAIFASPEIRRFLLRHNARDALFYRIMSSRPPPPCGERLALPR